MKGKREERRHTDPIRIHRREEQPEDEEVVILRHARHFGGSRSGGQRRGDVGGDLYSHEPILTTRPVISRSLARTSTENLTLLGLSTLGASERA